MNAITAPIAATAAFVKLNFLPIVIIMAVTLAVVVPTWNWFKGTKVGESYNKTLDSLKAHVRKRKADPELATA